MGTNKEVRQELEMLYTAKCMLTLEQCKTTYHHLQKKCKKGKETIENGALLEQQVHQWLHNDIERNDKETYYLINECLKLYKKCLMENRQELVEQWEQEVVWEVQKILTKDNNKQQVA